MKKYKWNFKRGLLALLFVSSPVLATVDSSGYKFSAYGGWQQSILNPSSFTLRGNEIEQLVPNNNKSTDFLWGIGAAYRFLTPDHTHILRYTHDISLGIDMFDFQTSQRGTALDYNVNPDFNYRLKVQSLRFMGNVEWTFLPVTAKTIYPFLEVGGGVVSNANYYFDTPNPNTPDGVGASFSRHSSIQFAYDLGAGLKWMPTKTVELSFRYLYSHLGSVRSGTRANLLVDTPYSMPLKTQSLLLGISYLL